jgi:hypothetical protein
MNRKDLLIAAPATLLVACSSPGSALVNPLLSPSSRNAVRPQACAGGRALFQKGVVVIETASGQDCQDYTIVATATAKQLPTTVQFSMTQFSDQQEFKLDFNDPRLLMNERKLIKFFEMWLQRVEKQKVVVYAPGPGAPLMEVSTWLSEPLKLTAQITDVPTGKVVTKSVKLHKELSPDDECSAAQLAFAACLIVCIAAWCAAVIDWPLAIAASLALASAADQMNDQCPQ